MEPREPVAARIATTITAKIIVRHAATCPSKGEGSDYRHCKCRKSLLVYEGGGSGTNRRISAKTRSWEKAETFLKGYLDSFDPDKQELKRLKAEKERATVRIEEAVSLYTQDMIARLGDNGTVAGARALLGNVNPETKAIVKNGHFFDWLDKFNSTRPAEQRLVYVSEITSTHLTMWRATWNYGSDLTAWSRWLGVKGFFKFCDQHNWTHRDGNPAAKIKNLEKSNETRTTIFSDAQYEAIVAAVSQYEPGNKVAQKRLLCFVELLRWAGMAIGDGLHYTPDMVKDGGTLQYARRKNGQLATIPLPPHVLKLLGEIPLEKNAPDMPFRDQKLSVEADLRKWDKALRKLFTLAGIDKVRIPDTGKEKQPHPHMLRDTFAVWHLRHGAQLRTVSKMLGHADTTTTERSYLPWVKELEAAHIADGRKALENGKAGKRTKKSS